MTVLNRAAFAIAVPVWLVAMPVLAQGAGGGARASDGAPASSAPAPSAPAPSAPAGGGGGGGSAPAGNNGGGGGYRGGDSGGYRGGGDNGGRSHGGNGARGVAGARVRATARPWSAPRSRARRSRPRVEAAAFTRPATTAGTTAAITIRGGTAPARTAGITVGTTAATTIRGTARIRTRSRRSATTI